MSYKVELSEKEVREIIIALELRSFQIFDLTRSEDLPFPYDSDEVRIMREKIVEIDKLLVRLKSLE